MATVNGFTNTKPPVLPGASMLPPMESPASIQEPKTSRGKNGKPTNKRATSDRFGVLNAFVDCSMNGLSKTELATWLILYRDTRNGTACTAQTDIARRAGLSVRSVATATAKLTKKGLVAVVFQGGLNRGPSRYRVEPLMKLASSVLMKKSVAD